MHYTGLIGGIAIAAGTLLLVVVVLAMPSPFAAKQVYGVTFSALQAEGIGLDWRQTYEAILNDLGVRRLRLSAYWNQVEPEEGQFDFEQLDYQMDAAAAHSAKVILGIGRKLPRWPECHEPAWVQGRSQEEKQELVLNLIEQVAKRYREHPALRMWQLENEPLLDFGECPPEDRVFLAREEALLKSLDSSHPIMITDSGELNSWIPAAGYGDVLGTTMYRTVFSSRTQKLFHYDYLFPSWLYRLKARLVKVIRGNEVLISELQGEPWGAAPFTEMSVAQRRASLSLERFDQLQRFAARTQLPEAYWWGVEYWYWEREVNGEPRFWEAARELF